MSQPEPDTLALALVYLERQRRLGKLDDGQYAQAVEHVKAQAGGGEGEEFGEWDAAKHPHGTHGYWASKGEGAAAPAAPFDKLKDADAWGAAHCTLASPLTADEQAAVKHYRTRFFSDINGILRDPAYVLPPGRRAKAQEAVRRLDEVMGRSSIDSPVVARRSIQTSRPITDGMFQVGSVYQDQGLTSTTISHTAADQFSSFNRDHSVHVEVEIPAGSKGIYLKDRHEAEILLPRGCMFRVTARERDERGQLRVRLKIIHQGEEGRTELFAEPVVPEPASEGPADLSRFVGKEGDLVPVEPDEDAAEDAP